MGLAVILIFALALFIYGVNAYRGSARGWTVRGKGYLGLGYLYFGLAGLLTPLATWLLRNDILWLGLPIGLVMTVSMLLLILSFFWLPRFLRPQWVKDWEARGRDPREFSPFKPKPDGGAHPTADGGATP